MKKRKMAWVGGIELGRRRCFRINFGVSEYRGTYLSKDKFCELQTQRDLNFDILTDTKGFVKGISSKILNSRLTRIKNFDEYKVFFFL